jgi:hypothetical protein
MDFFKFPDIRVSSHLLARILVLVAATSIITFARNEIKSGFTRISKSEQYENTESSQGTFDRQGRSWT